MEKLIKVINLDDHNIVNNGLSGILNGEPSIEFLGSFKTAKKTLDYLKKNEVDVILTDLHLDKSDLQGIGFAVEVKKLCPNIKIIAYTMDNNEKTIKEAFAVDMDGYVLKSDNNKEITRAIETVSLEGLPYYSPSIGPIVLGKRFFHPEEIAAILREMTKREMEILCLISKEFSPRDIAEQLNVSIDTVNTHRKNLYAKIGAKNDVGLANFALRNQLCS